MTARWPEIRARGRARFLLVRGVLTWGGAMFLLLAVMVTLQLGTAHPRLPLLIALAALFSALGGLFWAAISWWMNERVFQASRNGQHP